MIKYIKQLTNAELTMNTIHNSSHIPYDYQCLLNFDFSKTSSINIDVRRNELSSSFGMIKYIKQLTNAERVGTVLILLLFIIGSKQQVEDYYYFG